ncbi:hypothetical protein DOM21_13430 [Bacteriovorax stolpii]|uniref:Uncharacterized protein n=1 Tax=Bacteriovorax stolpii TaxID=960 RepID=A0A2K9NQ10_BACTC|nr:hypothetical protein [Bacteriovorax stolpii]AUN97598.1 hypothetical protein C0V70_05615 [Bacteriovorax stolpii]QDK42429.1 hypothetical protein DOM21_13430 [Bacteriovorax stolpii]TDP52780.1 hypothetical protein C8D79_2546 [Bacteriovorax stolpii]
MKANLLILTLLTVATVSVQAKEVLYTEGGKASYAAYPVSDYKFPNQQVAVTDNEKDMKIANLNKLLDQQQRLYEEKITYLEDELKKSKDRLIEKSINTDKMTALTEKRYSEETAYLKKELVAKTRTVMEYQRQLEKMKPADDMKNLIKVNTELALELRKSNDQLAIIQLKGNEAIAQKVEEKTVTGGRMPASVGK